MMSHSQSEVKLPRNYKCETFGLDKNKKGYTWGKQEGHPVKLLEREGTLGPGTYYRP